MPYNWNQWEGKTVNDRFPLIRYMGGSERSAVFFTEREDKGRSGTAAIKLIPVAPENGERQLSRWEHSGELSHPHLIPLYETGQCEVNGVLLVYVVMECAEENLAQVLPTRALDAAEARQMLESVLNVLSYLHSKGFVHGGIKPGNIMASGDQLKVSSDALHRAGEMFEAQSDRDAYRAPENGAEGQHPAQPISYASDVWSVGVTLIETLTQRLPAAPAESYRDPLVPVTLPEPFLDIARHCLRREPQDRWTVDHISARLLGRAVVPERRPAARRAEPAVRTPQPVVPHAARPANRNRYAVPFAIGFVLVLASILVGPKLLHRESEAPQASPVPAEQPAPAPATSQQQTPTPAKTPADSSISSLIEEQPGSNTPVPLAASVHPESAPEVATNTAAKMGSDSPARGRVAHQVLPEVLQSARNSIRGTVRVSVKVNVDRSGNVEDAELASRGPSKYFARAAVDAAQSWKFNPPKVGGRGVLSSWILEFEFTRDGTNVVPTQELP